MPSKIPSIAWDILRSFEMKDHRRNERRADAQRLILGRFLSLRFSGEASAREHS
jgi:hypothetical protein